MLFFIEIHDMEPPPVIQFKYISCYSLSLPPSWSPARGWIQIHLMLFFIVLRGSVFAVLSHSNTSHVILYRCIYWFRCEFAFNSNTSHVILYQQPIRKDQIKMLYSNTSHVILYPGSAALLRPIFYIQIHLMLFFISELGKIERRKTWIQIHLMLFFISSPPAQRN